MKRYPTFFVIAILILLNACKQNNKLKFSEASLKSDIQTESDSLSGIVVKYSEEDSENKIKELKEERSIDKKHKPIRIALSSNLANRRQIKLSDIASKIRYLKLEVPDEPNYFKHVEPSDIICHGDNIFCSSVYGITHFDKTGRFINWLCKNKVVAGTHFIHYDRGAAGIIGVANGKLVYLYRDVLGKEISTFKYDFTGDTEKLMHNKKEEVTDDYKPKGNLIGRSNRVVDYNHRGCELLDENTYMFHNSEYRVDEVDNILTIRTASNDTICAFKNYNSVKKFTGRMARMADEKIVYRYKDAVCIRPAYNDTLFRLLSFNRLLPAYIFDFGEERLSLMDGLNISKSIKDKLMMNNCIESDSYLFMKYTKNNDCYNNRKAKDVDFYYAIYDKAKNETFYLEVDSKNYTYKLKNDIDNNFPFWPGIVNQSGEMMDILTKKDIEFYFDIENLNPTQASFYENLSGNEIILVLVQ